MLAHGCCRSIIAVGMSVSSARPFMPIMRSPTRRPATVFSLHFSLANSVAHRVKIVLNFSRALTAQVPYHLFSLFLWNRTTHLLR